MSQKQAHYKQFLIQRIMAWSAMAGISTYTQPDFAADTARQMEAFSIQELLCSERLLYQDVFDMAWNFEKAGFGFSEN